MTQSEDQLNLHAARLYLTRLLPHLAPFTQRELQGLTLKAGLWSLYQQSQPGEPTLTDHLHSHARLLRGHGSELDRLEAQHLRQSNERPGPWLRPSGEDVSRLPSNSGLEKMQQLAHGLGLPWFTRQPITRAKTQVSYRVTRSFERALHDAWKEEAPRGASRSVLQGTLALAYLSLPEFRARVRQVQDVRYARTPVTSVSQEARNVAALLTRCGLPARGAPALRNEVVQLSYRTTLAANDQLRRSLPAAERTLAYLHIDLLALYLTAPDIRAMIDSVIEDRAQK
ncbi:hypothetical protein [Deinococcus humi]|uniref:Uncharacterized protein n=1 Tax=Deinococcus humi TaxID=662880 RepID=A0A7W8JQS7_9DEIO|nr:hypothetical protein [Deinococcus humi]MBB5361225.1 hypothetical protein [Deinococcus humi]GGO19033.1 hypothetical protein GCM10008949_02930 [Deinococcus humi]